MITGAGWYPGTRFKIYNLKGIFVISYILPVRYMLLKQLKEKCKMEYQIKLFPGQTHGFAHRKSEDINPADKPKIEEARADMLNWHVLKYM